ncbi:calcium-binding protein, partial [Aquabacterium parvum]|uniref:calcium-binding protein n=1 Tax=Aquabacterium parvum TaxID=70584 RepID=UPI000A5D26D1
SDDTISFGDGISVSDVVFSVGSSGLIIRIKENGVLTNDQITVQNWNDTAYRIENFVFKDSASMSMATANLLSTAVVMAGDENGNSITGTTSSDIMQGHGGADSISAGEGSDVLFGGAEGDSLFGQAGDDTLYGESGGDTLDGGQGADTMYGGFGDDSYNVDDVGDRVIEAANGGNDTVDTTLSDYVLPDHVENLIMNGKAEVNTASGNALDNYIVGSWIGSNISGLAGNDTIVSYDGNDILDGGLGYDVLEGGSGDDVYYVDQTLMPGDNYVVDEVLEFDAYSGGIDTVYTDIADYVLPANVENLVMSGKSAFGNALNNVITGSDDANQVDSGNGNDQLIGLGGDDWLTGGEGNDIYVGGAGDDMLIDDAGDEHYTWGRGEGYDVISDGGGVDKLQVLDGVAADQIWLRQEGLALELQVIGTSDRLLIEGWFIDPLYQVESFELADGKTLNASNVQSLISAMAAFTPPAMGQTTLTAQQQSQLGQVIATNWV